MGSIRIGIIGVLPQEAGGAGTLTQRMLTELLDCSDHDEFVFVKEPQGFLNRIFVFVNDKLISSSTFNFLGNKFGFEFKSSLDRVFLRKKIDVVFFFSFNPKAALIKYTPYVVTVWDLGHLEYPFLDETGRGNEFISREAYYQVVLKRAQSVLVESEITKKSLSLIYGLLDDKITVMPFAPEYPPEISRQPSKSFLFFPAHFWPHKNHVVLLRALSLAKKRFANQRTIVFSGLDKGNLPFLQKYVKDNDLVNDVMFVGFLSAETLEEYYQSTEAVIYPSLLGPTNLPPLEGLLRNRPAIVSAISVLGMPDLPFVKVSHYDNPESWVCYFDLDFDLSVEVDVRAIREAVESVRIENVSKFAALLNSVRHLKMLSSE